MMAILKRKLICEICVVERGRFLHKIRQVALRAPMNRGLKVADEHRKLSDPNVALRAPMNRGLKAGVADQRLVNELALHCASR